MLHKLKKTAKAVLFILAPTDPTPLSLTQPLPLAPLPQLLDRGQLGDRNREFDLRSGVIDL
jgi:hypothetical protein